MASIVESLSASSTTLLALSSALSSTSAVALPRITLLANAPAPLRLAPPRPNMIAAEAAAVMALMVASSCASTVMLPEVVLMPVVVTTPAKSVVSTATSTIVAATSLSISL